MLWNELLYGGLSIRPGDAIAPVIGFEYGKTKSEKLSRSEQIFRFGYSYDATLSEVANYSSGSHEIFVSYMFNFERIPMQSVTQTPIPPRIGQQLTKPALISRRGSSASPATGRIPFDKG